MVCNQRAHLLHEEPFTRPPAVPGAERSASAKGLSLSNGLLSVVIDEETGAIASLRRKGIPSNLVDNKGGFGLNDYLYVAGRDPDPVESPPTWRTQ